MNMGYGSARHHVQKYQQAEYGSGSESAQIAWIIMQKFWIQHYWYLCATERRNTRTLERTGQKKTCGSISLQKSIRKSQKKSKRIQIEISSSQATVRLWRPPQKTHGDVRARYRHFTTTPREAEMVLHPVRTMKQSWGGARGAYASTSG